MMIYILDILAKLWFLTAYAGVFRGALNIEEEPSNFRKSTSIMLSPITTSVDLASWTVLGVAGFGLIAVTGAVVTPFTGKFPE